jgi:hypothetical protein
VRVGSYRYGRCIPKFCREAQGASGLGTQKLFKTGTAPNTRTNAAALLGILKAGGRVDFWQGKHSGYGTRCSAQNSAQAHCDQRALLRQRVALRTRLESSERSPEQRTRCVLSSALGSAAAWSEGAEARQRWAAVRQRRYQGAAGVAIGQQCCWARASPLCAPGARLN